MNISECYRAKAVTAFKLLFWWPSEIPFEVRYLLKSSKRSRFVRLSIYSSFLTVVDSFTGIYEILPPSSLLFISFKEYMNPYRMRARRDLNFAGRRAHLSFIDLFVIWCNYLSKSSWSHIIKQFTSVEPIHSSCIHVFSNETTINRASAWIQGG